MPLRTRLTCLALTILAASCTSSPLRSGGTGGTTSSGGNSAAGGSAGGGAAAGADGSSGGCTNVNPCGGNVVGTWSVASSCLAVSGNADLGSLGIGCQSPPVTGSLQVSGTWSARSDGTYTDNTVTTGAEQFVMPKECLSISGTTTDCAGLAGVLGGFFDSVTCSAATNGGCNCSAKINQQGWPGWPSVSATGSGNYQTASNVVSIDSEPRYSYCVASDQMTWSLKPASKGATVTGSIVFQGASMTGSGGAGGRPTGSSGGGAGGAAAAGGKGGGGKGGAGGRGAGGTTVPALGPCDIYAAASTPTPCVAAYSMGRLIYSKYTGPLYQVRKGGSWDKSNGPSGGTTMDIGTAAGGYADAAAQDTFCAGSTCTVSILYDQSGKKNDLKAGPAGCYTGGDGAAAEADKESVANRRKVTIAGHTVYALQTVPHDGYRNDKTAGMPTATAAQGIYMVADGTKAGTTCCWDFGNAMPTNCADGTGSMDALMLGTGGFGKGAGGGPWFIGDFEFGVWACGSQSSSQACTNPNLPSMNAAQFAFGVLKTSMSGNSGQYCIRVADPGTSALETAYDGQAPQPWHLGGAIILGIGGDNSNWSFGTFFEGAVTAGRPADDTDAQVYANFQTARYGQ